MKRLATGIAAAVSLTVSPAFADDALRSQASALFGQVKAPPASSPQAELGRALFWDERISGDGKTSCASCHLAKDWGSDARRFSTDARGKPTSRHSQTVFNSMPQASLRWHGDRRDGADQAEGSLTGSLGFADKGAALAKLQEHGYASAFKAAWPQEASPFSTANYGRALAAYQATLATPSAFDRFLAGDDRALDARQKAGLRAFVATGCAGCHAGPLLGGTMLQKFGVTRDYWLETGSEKATDPGRFAVTKKDEDRHVFRVPMLRNVAKTAPYFHDGSVATLDRAVRVMAAVQLGRALSDADTASIVAFLESLTGEVPAHYAPPPRPN